jgi:hypothetical protein
MKKSELEKVKLYVHTGLIYEKRRTEPLKFVKIQERKQWWEAVFQWDNGNSITVHGWAVEKWVKPYKKSET